MRFLQLLGVCYLELTRQAKKGTPRVVSHEELPLWGLVVSLSLRSASCDLNHNMERLRALDAYDRIMIADVFPSEIAAQIAQEWEQANPRLKSPQA